MSSIPSTKLSLFSIAAMVTVLALLFASVSYAAPSTSAGAEKVRVIIELASPVAAADRAMVRGFGGTINHEYSIVSAMAVEVPVQALSGLERSPRVVSVEEDVVVQAMLFEDEYAETWSIENVKAKPVHDSGNTGTGVKIGIIDSGVSTAHPDLTVVGGYDFVDNDADPDDVYGHGTHVAGTACATMNGGGAVGVAPNCDLYSLRVLNDSGSGYTSDVIAAVEWAANNGLDVINLSLGTSQDPGSAAQAVYDAAYAAGVVIVAAAGNSGNPRGNGTNTIWPANYDSVIAVAATDSNNNRASFSSTGNNVELSAPGAAVHSAWNDSTSPHNPQPVCDATYGCFKDGSGTSMASPQVAGVAALVIAAGIADQNSDGNVNDEVRAKLQSTAVDLGSNGKDTRYGYGLVDASAAVADLGPTDLAPQVTLDSPSQGMLFMDVATTVVSMTASDDVGIASAKLFINGLEVTSSFNAGTLEYEWTLPTDADGLYTVRAEATDTSNQTVSTEVTVEVDNVDEAPTANAGADQSVYVGELVNFDGSGSSDDRGIATYAWDFADGNVGNGELTSHTYNTLGTYVVTLTVTDTNGVSVDDTVTITVEEVPAGATEAVVDSISYTTEGGRFQDMHLLVATTILDNLGNPVGNAAVSVRLDHDSGSSWIYDGTTSADGTFSVKQTSAPSGDYVTTITNLQAAGLTWGGTTPINSFSK